MKLLKSFSISKYNKVDKPNKLKKKKNIKLSLILFTAVFVIIFSFLTKEIYAQPSQDITISPPKFEETVSPGQTISSSIKIINTSDDEVLMEAVVYDFKPSGEEGRQTFISPESEDPYIDHSLSIWISINTEPFTIGPKSTKEVNFSIEVPESAEPGGHYAAIFFGPPSSEGIEGETETALHGGKVSVRGEIGTLLLIRVGGEVKELASIKEFTSVKKLWEKTPVTLITRFYNLGNVHLKPEGFVDIYGFGGKKIDTLNVNKEKGNVLPISVRKFETNWENKAAFGKYTAKLSLVYGEKNKVVTAETIFWVIPWKKILFGIIGLIVLIVILIWGIKRYNRWIIRKAKSM
jgi:hypothetical protein